MKHPHYDVMMKWAADTRKVVQCREHSRDPWEDMHCVPGWHDDFQYRIKPTPKPDVVCEGVFGTYNSGHLCYHVSSGAPPNLRLTFDGETGKLKSAEVL